MGDALLNNIHLRCQHLLLVLLLLPAAVLAEALVYTDKAHPVTAATDARIVLLDQQYHLETELSRALPSDPQQAAAIIHVRLNSPSGKRLQSDLAKAQHALPMPGAWVSRRSRPWSLIDVMWSTANRMWPRPWN